MSFAELKKNRSASISKLAEAAEKVAEGKKSYADERFWAPTVDKAGNGYAVIRFLPASEGENLPWVRYWDHGFKGPTGRWYIENSLTSIGKDDPVGEMNAKLWNSGNEADKETVRQRKRRLHYVSNVLVISDPANPANDGKVFLYKYGKKIFDKIVDIMQPEFEDEKPVNPFDFWEGANFKLKIRKVEGYRNYDKSEFEDPTPLFGGDDKKLEAIYKQLNKLQDFIDPKNYKSYEELAKKLREVLGDEALTPAERAGMGEAAPAPKSKTVEAPAQKTQDADDTDGDAPEQTGGNPKENLSYFARLAAGED